MPARLLRGERAGARHARSEKCNDITLAPCSEPGLGAAASAKLYRALPLKLKVEGALHHRTRSWRLRRLFLCPSSHSTHRDRMTSRPARHKLAFLARQSERLLHKCVEPRAIGFGYPGVPRCQL